jgi:F0F1-type ATP synthase membrane subunit b/b'
MTRRSPARAPAPIPTTYSPSPLLSISTITYIASWRGQLLICTIVLFLGAIYFVIRRPIQDHLRRRKEEIARARQRELMRSESDAEERKEKVKETIGDAVVVGEKTKEQRERGREKKKELKKRKGLLRVPTGLGSGTDTTASASASPSLAGPSSLESSPVPKSAELRKRSISHQSPSPSTSPLLSPIPSTPDRQPQIRIRDTEPASSGSGVDVDETPKSSKRAPRQSPTITESADRSMRHALSAEQIPLPPSPSPGPSRLAVPSSEGYMSDTTSNASYSEYQSQSPSKPSTKMKSEGFSTIPEDGWLPPSLTAPASSTKKKKRKGRQSEVTDISISSPLPSDTRPATSSGNPDTGSSIHGPSPARRHSRQDSLTLSRPINATSKEYEAYIDRMEGTIDRLRGELGASVSTTRMAKEAEEEAKQGQERAKAEVMKYKQKLQTVDAHKRREADVSHFIYTYGKGENSADRSVDATIISRETEFQCAYSAGGRAGKDYAGQGESSCKWKWKWTRDGTTTFAFSSWTGSERTTIAFPEWPLPTQWTRSWTPEWEWEWERKRKHVAHAPCITI